MPGLNTGCGVVRFEALYRQRKIALHCQEMRMIDDFAIEEEHDYFRRSLDLDVSVHICLVPYKTFIQIRNVIQY